MTDLVEVLARAMCCSDGCCCAMFDDLGACQREPDKARIVLTALEAAGYRVVPVEPTKEMIEEGDGALEWDSSDRTGHWFVHYHDGDAAKSWAAMLAAAPKINTAGEN